MAVGNLRIELRTVLLWSSLKSVKTRSSRWASTSTVRGGIGPQWTRTRAA